MLNEWLTPACVRVNSKERGTGNGNGQAAPRTDLVELGDRIDEKMFAFYCEYSSNHS
jgi:hypothetical protein